MKTEIVMNELKKVAGLYSFILLNEEDKKEIKKIEDEWNVAVHECLKKRFTILAVHDSVFEEPKEIFKVEKKGRVFLLPVNFDYIDGMRAISSSPSIKVHQHLVDKFGMKLRAEEATLLIGFGSK